MKYRPDETLLIGYLYGELQGEEKQKVDDEWKMLAQENFEDLDEEIRKEKEPDVFWHKVRY